MSSETISSQTSRAQTRPRLLAGGADPLTRAAAIACAAATLLILAALLRWPTSEIPWRTNATDAFSRTLVALGLASLFVERVVEVFLAIGQNPQGDIAATERSERERDVHRAGTRRLASWLALVVGVLTAAVGFRMLGNLVDTSLLQPTASTPSGYQYTWFVVVDTLLTGAMLAGGSQGIHQITNVFGSFLETSRVLIEKRKRAQPPSATEPLS